MTEQQKARIVEPNMLRLNETRISEFSLPVLREFILRLPGFPNPDYILRPAAEAAASLQSAERRLAEAQEAMEWAKQNYLRSMQRVSEYIQADWSDAEVKEAEKAYFSEIK